MKKKSLRFDNTVKHTVNTHEEINVLITFTYNIYYFTFSKLFVKKMLL